MSTRFLARVAATNILRNHFDTEASDAGLRSLDLESTGARSSASYDSSAVARADQGHGHDHRRVRATLKRLDPKQVEMLSLAFAIRLRTRDTEDSKKRRAVRQNERNWRVRLAELFGQEGAIVLGSPLAQRMFAKHVEALTNTVRDVVEAPIVGILGSETESAEDVFARGRDYVWSPRVVALVHEAATAAASGLITWLLSAKNDQIEEIRKDAHAQLNEALDAFAEAHGITSQPLAPRHRSSERTRVRVLASYPEHGQEIGG